MSESPHCALCSHGLTEDPEHALLLCDHNSVVNDWILAILINLDPTLVDYDLISTNIVRFNLVTESDKRLPVIFFLSSAFQIIWQKRQARKAIVLQEIIALIEAEVSILKMTKHTQAATIIESALKFSLGYDL